MFIYFLRRTKVSLLMRLQIYTLNALGNPRAGGNVNAPIFSVVLSKFISNPLMLSNG